MGIKNLSKILNETTACKVVNRKFYKNKLIAIDATIWLYQFFVQIRHDSQQLTDENGEVTSHLQGFLQRTIMLLNLGIKPVFVFDGPAPKLKENTLKKRKEVKEQAHQDYLEAVEKQDSDEANKFSKRSINITKEQINEVKQLLTYLGLPVISAPGEAEAQCTELVKCGICYAVASEDLDVLAFGAPRMIRNLTSADKPIEIDLSVVLRDLEFTYEQFVDMCILCGCDYISNIPGIGPKTALNHIKKYKTIDDIPNIPSEYIDVIPSIRDAFTHPLVIHCTSSEIKFNRPDKARVLEFLLNRNFNEARVINVLSKLDSSEQKTLSSFMKKS
jgi:flap endonuclease-1